MAEIATNAECCEAALPPLLLPRELMEQVEIPAAQFEVKDTLPMKVTTAAYQLPLKFSLTALCLLEGRLAVAQADALAAAGLT